MKNYDTQDNTTGTFPNVLAENATGPGETDGTPYNKQWIEDMWGARQALMDDAGLTPNAAQETPGNSQFVDALKQVMLQERLKSQLGLRNWKIEQNPGFLENVLGLTYGLGHWISVGPSADPVHVSQNGGQTFYFDGSIAAHTFNDVFCSDTHCVLVGIGGRIYWATDPNGTYTSNDHGSDAFESVHYANNIWVACTDQGDIYTATDPTGTWTLRTTPASSGTEDLNALVYVADLGLWICVGEKSGGFSGIITATDPTGTWTERTNPIGGTPVFEDIGYDGTNVIAVGGSGGASNCVRSTDGTSYVDKSSALPSSTNLVPSIAADPYGHAVIFQGNSTDKGIYLSEDGGDNWDLLSKPGHVNAGDAGFYSAERGQFMFVGGGAGNAYAHRSLLLR